MSVSKNILLENNSVDTKDVNLEILYFKQFYKRFVFDKDEEGYVKKIQKNHMILMFCIDMIG